jgi:DNA-binding IclR family transcriptional regulator
MAEPNTLQTLDRGLRVLELVSESPDGLSIAELAERLEVHRAICYRLVTTLEGRGLVSRTRQGRIRLGAAVAVLAARFEPQLRRDAQPLLTDLAEETHATAFLSLAEGDEAVVVSVAEPHGTFLRVGYRVGSRHPLSRGAAGIAILALRPAKDDDLDDVTQARRAGFSHTAGQLERGAVGVSAGVRRAGAELSVGVVAMEGLDVEKAADAVMRAAQELERMGSH